MAKTKLYSSPYGAPTKHVVKMASLVVTCSQRHSSLAVTWMLSLNLGHTNGQRSGQVYHTVLPRQACYSYQINRVC